MHLGQAVRINHDFNGCYTDNNGQSLSFMNYARTKATQASPQNWARGAVLGGLALWLMWATAPEKVRFNSANGTHFVISWLKSFRLTHWLRIFGIDVDTNWN